MSSINMKNSSEEINLINILKTLIRERNLIFFVVIVLTSLSSIYYSKVKPIFAGSFEIVLSEKNVRSKSQANDVLGLLTNQTNSIDTSTQKLILTSPTVLKSVHDYVNNYKTELTGRLVNKNFKPWVRNNLFLEFKENSNVLGVTYMDTNKDLIINVLNLISEKYQDYSTSSTIKSLEDRRKYLEEQKIILSNKLNLSKKEYNKFTIDNGLGNIDGFISLGNFNRSVKNTSLSNLNDDSAQKGLKNIENSETQFTKKSDSKAGQRFKMQFTLLENYESEFVNISSKLKPNSKTLKILKGKIDNLKESLKRPNEILIKYDELYKTYLRDEKLLNMVEDNLALTKLEQIRNLNTWEIISSPIVGNKPIYPKRLQIFILFLFGSSILGSFIALIKEKLSKIVFLIEDIEKQLDCNYIDEISKKDKELSFKQILNVFDFNSKKGKANFGIMNYKNKVDLEFMKDSLYMKEDIEIKEINDFSLIKEYTQIILIIQSGKYTFEEIKTINKYISFSKEKVIGWFFIQD